MSRPISVALLSLLTACQVQATELPTANQGASLAALHQRITELERPPEAHLCAMLDQELGTVPDHEDRMGMYLRAELAAICGDLGRWAALHAGAASEGYLPAALRLVDGSTARGQWDEAVSRAIDAETMSGDESRRQAIEDLTAALVHARWMATPNEADFEALEQAAKNEVVRRPKDLDARASLIRLYAQRAAILDDPRPLLLAQITEQEARKLNAKLGHGSARLELVCGFLRELEGDRVAAIAGWEKALAVNAALDEPRLWLGHAALATRDFDRAERQLRRYVQSFPEHLDGRVALGIALRGLGDEVGASRVSVEIEAHRDREVQLTLDVRRLQSAVGLRDLMALTTRRIRAFQRTTEMTEFLAHADTGSGPAS